MEKDLSVIKIKNVSRGKRGVSLIEAVIAVGIFGLLVASLGQTIFYPKIYIASSALKSKAFLLAEEGLEASRNLRDSNFTNLSDGTHGILKSGTAWVFSGSNDTTEIFKRTITISTVDTNTKNVESKIEWSDKGAKSITLSERLAYWMKPRAVNAVAKWPLDENTGCTAHDSMGTNDGTLKPTCPTPLNCPAWISGTGKKVGTSALSFDGSDDYVQVPDANALDLSTAGTLMAWIYPTKNATMGIIHKGIATDGSDEAYFLQMDSGKKLTGGGRNAANIQVVKTTGNQLSLNSWNHVAFTWDATGMKLYINGVADYPANSTILDARNSSGALQLGASYPTGNKNFFQGKIDEVSIYNYALTESDILTIYNSQK